MSPIKPLNNLILFGIFLGVYRTNFWTKKKITIFFIVSQIVIGVLFHTFMTIGEVYYLFKDGDFTPFEGMFCFFTGLAYFNYLSAVVTGISYCKEFECYLENIKLVYECYTNDSTFQKSLKKINWFCVFYVCFALVFTILKTLETLLQFDHSNLFIMAIIFATQFMIRATILLQHFSLFVVIVIVICLVKCVNMSVLAVQLGVSRGVKLGQECDVTMEQIEDWVDNYHLLVDCCANILRCFGRTFMLSLGLVITHFIFLAYFLCYITILELDSSLFRKISFIIFGYVTLLLLPIVAGQVLRNQAVKLHRLTVRLYNHIIIGPREAEAKSIKDFIRLQKKKRLEINFTPKIPAGLYMLPVILSFSVENIVLLLQLYHVV